MALFIPDMAGHLFLVVLLFDTFQSIKAQGPPLPRLTVSPAVIRESDSVQLRCHTSQSTSVSQCYFFIEERQHLQQNTSCQQSLTGTKLLEWAGQRTSTKVNMRCIYYAVEMSIYSPYSDPVSVTLLDLPQPKLTVSSTVIRESDSVQLSCDSSPSVSVSQCYFYTEGRDPKPSPCTRSLTGAELLSWAGERLSAEVKLRCFYTVETHYPSTHSRPAPITILGELQKPDISVNDESSHDITITCVLPESVSDGHSCNLYTGDQPQAYKEAWVRRFNTALSNLFCTFNVTKNDLFRHLQLERDLSCDYRVNTGSHSLSPRSDKYIITVGLTPGPRSTLPPSTTVSPTEVSTVTSTLTPDTTVTPTTSLTSPLTPSTAVNPTSGGQSSTESVLVSTVTSTLTPDITVRPTTVQLWQAALCMASGVGVFLMGLTAVYLCRRTKTTNSQRPTARQDDHSQCDLVMGAMSSAGMLDSRDAGIYSLITSVPSTFLPSGPVQVSANGDADSENAGVYSLITSVPSTSIPLGPFEENVKSSENHNSDTYHVYSSIPDRPATSAQPDGLYSLLQTH